MIRDDGVIRNDSEIRDDSLDRACALLFTKPPRAGKVKTRLIGEWSAEQAAELHAAFLADVRASLRRGRFALQTAWALEPGEPRWHDPGDPGGEGFRQQGEDLGARLLHGLGRGLQRYELVAAVGSDSPELDSATVEDGFRRLAAGADVVLGPTADGGYYLIGVRAGGLRDELFDGIPWSTGEVFARTVDRCRQLGLELALLPAGYDVDVADDLRRLARRLAAAGDGLSRPGACRHTREVLSQWGLL